MRRLPLLLAAVLALSLSACQAPPKKKPAAVRKAPVSASDRKAAEALYIQGVYAYAEGRTEAAIADWRACLKRNPRHEKARQALVEAKAKQEAVKKLK